jgi:hypothetical protein
MRVLVAGTPVRLWPFMAVPMMTLFVITGMALGFAATKRAAPGDALTSPDATATAAPDAAAEATPQRAASAAPGSEKPREERTSAETIAIAEFESDTKRREIHALGKELLEHPELANDPKKLLVLKAAVYQRDTWLVALEAMAALPGPVGPDLLYRSWTATKARTDATKLAEELVYSKDVRSKASEALSIALDLRAAETCEASKALLPRATEHGDHRSLGELARLLQTRGCGPKKLDDCNACLREGSALDDAIAAAKKRTPPPH